MTKPGFDFTYNKDLVNVTLKNELKNPEVFQVFYDRVKVGEFWDDTENLHKKYPLLSDMQSWRYDDCENHAYNSREDVIKGIIFQYFKPSRARMFSSEYSDWYFHHYLVKEEIRKFSDNIMAQLDSIEVKNNNNGFEGYFIEKDTFFVVKLSITSMAGRTLIQLEIDNSDNKDEIGCWVSLIGETGATFTNKEERKKYGLYVCDDPELEKVLVRQRPEKSSVGIQGVYASLREILHMVKVVNENWNVNRLTNSKGLFII